MRPTDEPPHRLRTVAPILSTRVVPHDEAAQLQRFTADPLGAAESFKEEPSLKDGSGFGSGKLQFTHLFCGEPTFMRWIPRCEISGLKADVTVNVWIRLNQAQQLDRLS